MNGIFFDNSLFFSAILASFKRQNFWISDKTLIVIFIGYGASIRQHIWL